MKKIACFIFLLLNVAFAYPKEFTFDVLEPQDEYLVIDEITAEEYIEEEPVYETYREAYFDGDWNRTTKENATYRRLVVWMDNCYKAFDFYLSTGHLQGVGCFETLDNEERIGLFRFYYPDGRLESEGNYDENNYATGEWKFFYPDGTLKMTMWFKDDEVNGERISYYPNGATARIELYEDSQMMYGTCFNKKGEKIDFYDYCEQAVYSGKNIQKDLVAAMLKWKKKDGLENQSAVVYLKTTINKKGKITDIRVTESTNELFNETAVKVISDLKRFKPATQEKEPIASVMNFTLSF